MFKKLIKLLSSKAGITAFSFLLQLSLIVVGVMYAAGRFRWVWYAFDAIDFLICLYIISKDINPSYKLSWCILVLALPGAGALIYFFIGRQHTSRRVRKRLKRATAASQVLFNLTNATIANDRRVLNPTDSTLADLVLNSGSFPIYNDTQTKYYALGDEFFPDLVADISVAQKFIFLEFFIIEPGKVWDEIESVLIERASNGVDVKIIYDDVGCVFTLPKKRIKRLRAAGIKMLPFNKITFTFDMRLNNRSHRKIAVIDGKIAYCGGNNIADEYANKTVRFGHWKDTHMRFYGAAVWSFTVMFLSFWMTLDNQPVKYADYLVSERAETDATGYVQPLSSGPDRNDHLIESAFINMISTAKRSVYITTPYLILDNEIQSALIDAARAGIDVRIIIPHVPDKKTVYLATKSFVPILTKAGVKVYSYTPGFIHAKMVIADGERAFIGTCNMDYRSFYLHYECGALLYNNAAITAMKTDFLNTQEKSHLITHDEADNVTVFTRFARALLRLIAPMM